MAKGEMNRELSEDQLAGIIGGVNCQDKCCQYTYDENGNLSRETKPNGVVVDFGYDELDREGLRSYSLPPAPTGDDVAAIAQSFDANDNVVQVVESYHGGSRPNRVTTFGIEPVLLQNGPKDRFELGERSRSDDESVAMLWHHSWRVVDQVIGSVPTTTMVEELYSHVPVYSEYPIARVVDLADQCAFVGLEFQMNNRPRHEIRRRPRDRFRQPEPH